MDKTFPQTYISYYNHTYLPSIPLTSVCQHDLRCLKKRALGLSLNWNPAHLNQGGGRVQSVLLTHSDRQVSPKRRSHY